MWGSSERDDDIDLHCVELFSVCFLEFGHIISMSTLQVLKNLWTCSFHSDCLWLASLQAPSFISIQCVGLCTLCNCSKWIFRPVVGSSANFLWVRAVKSAPNMRLTATCQDLLYNYVYATNINLLYSFHTCKFTVEIQSIHSRSFCIELGRRTHSRVAKVDRERTNLVACKLFL